MAQTVLPVDFYDRDVREVARGLIGKVLVTRRDRQRVSGMIIETEAYLPKRDTASHAYLGPNRKNRAMFGPPGIAYVYPIHARYCFNVVTQAAGIPCAVLIRAVQPLSGLVQMKCRRKTETLELLTSGPARLCEAFAIDRQMDELKLTSRRHAWLESNSSTNITAQKIRITRRIGVTSGKQLRLRYVLRGNRFVSGPRSLS